MRLYKSTYIVISQSYRTLASNIDLESLSDSGTPGHLKPSITPSYQPHTMLAQVLETIFPVRKYAKSLDSGL